MKIIMIAACACLLATAATAQEVTLKKGKAIMSEAYYNEMQNQLAMLQAQNAQLQIQLVEAQSQAAKPVELRTFNDSASYAIGQDIYNSWNAAQLGINGKAAAQGMTDAELGQFNMSPDLTRALLQQFQQNFENRGKEQIQANIKAGKDFMTQNANNKSVFTTKSGLQYQRLQAGKGAKPKVGDHVVVHYTGTLINGSKFDSSLDRNQPFEFDLGRGMVIPGWDEGIQLMEKGSKYRLVIPYNLGYGEREVGAIPAGSTLIFDVELIDFTSPKK